MSDSSASAFAALRALDSSEPLRRELLAAGVSPARVASLYPPEFAALVPGIIQALTHNPQAIENFPPLAGLVDRIVYARSEFMPTTVRYPEICASYVSAVESDPGLRVLTDWVKANTQGIASVRDWHSLKLGETTFFAHAFMVHYGDLEPAHQADAAALIEGVVHQLELR